MRQIFLLLIFISAVTTNAQVGIIKESLKLKSAILGKEVEYSLYLPPDYDQSNRRYPVLYLLHGYTDDETGWTQFGEVKAIADKQLQNMEMTSMIIAMPDGGVSWYINSADGKVKYEDFFIKEFIPHIDASLRTRAEKRYRGIAGLSMGGHGTMIMAVKYPNLFAVAAPLSAGIFTRDELVNMPDESWDNVFGPPYGKNKGETRVTDHLKKNWILSLVNDAQADDLKKVKYYIDCGDKDFLIKGNMELHSILIDKKVPHEFRVREGIHNWDYWRTALPEVFNFVSKSFHQ
ncbi:MAG TPA: alpha/beta hydrolase-fold protein [Cyclobacteriaceae bacterium]|nr:alpha/beta hydrolase-fold protein [Cyclobacteriaceae bacterium]HRJ80341.1 alpha/beta hydrolase-fold protein [Cyclobacteriaceae bacterium]